MKKCVWSDPRGMHQYRGAGEFRLRDAGLVLGCLVEPQSGLGRNRDYKVGGMHGGKDEVLD